MKSMGSSLSVFSSCEEGDNVLFLQGAVASQGFRPVVGVKVPAHLVGCVGLSVAL